MKIQSQQNSNSGDYLIATIERMGEIKFHDYGTLKSITQWITQHDEGLAEWVKNANRAYDTDRANVADEHKVVLILLYDSYGNNPSRIGLLDVGGVTSEDLKSWSTWQNPLASYRESNLTYDESETQGNGGKAYMYKMFTGQCKLLGIKENKLNCTGFEGNPKSVERGNPGFIPNKKAGDNAEIKNWKSELDVQLGNYGLNFYALPSKMQKALEARKSFTLVEGIAPIETWTIVKKGNKILADDLISKLIRHEQVTLAIQQTEIYVAHNSKILYNGKKLELEVIPPYPEFEIPFKYEVPEDLPNSQGLTQSTTQDGKKKNGVLTIYTSKENMEAKFKNLKPRWKVIYRAGAQPLGTKYISEIIPNTPGSQFVYSEVNLEALAPDYVIVGRKRPNDGPLIEALDIFIAEKMKEISKKINDKMKKEINKESLDEISKENEFFNQWKNQFLPSGGPEKGVNGEGEDGTRIHEGGPFEFGLIPDHIIFEKVTQSFIIGRNVNLNLKTFLNPSVKDKNEKSVRVGIDWVVDKSEIGFIEGDNFIAKNKGKCIIKAKVSKKEIYSDPITFEIWVIDHVLLTPRQLQIPLGTKKRIIAEVTNDEGRRLTEVILNWDHQNDISDPLRVRINQIGWVTGNRIGKTSITAGAGDKQFGMWARVHAEVEVVPNPNPPGKGEGFPQLLITEKDIDPETGSIREGDPEEPALWQEPADLIHNVWWINMQSPEANFASSLKDENPSSWRLFRSIKLFEMIAQVNMNSDFTEKGESEVAERWANHKLKLENFQIQYAQSFWNELKKYIETGDLPLILNLKSGQNEK